jgi:cellulose synthase operon protein C
MRRLIAIALSAFLIATPAAADRSGAEAALAQGVEALNSGNPRAARVNLLNAIKADPNWAQAHAVQGEVYLRLNDTGSALTEFNRALQLGVKPEAINHLVAQVWLKNGDPQRALVEASANRVDPRFAAAAARVRAQALAALGDIMGAGREFENSAAMDPNVPELWTDIARYRYQNGNIVGAQQAGARAAELNPRNTDALLLMADLVRGQYGPLAALPWYERTIEVDPDNMAALRELAATQGDVGRTIAMLATTRKMLTLDPTNADAFYLQAVLAARSGDYDLARSLFYRTGEKLREVPAAMLLGATLALESGNEEQAIAQLAHLLERQPNNVQAKRLLGAAYVRLGDPQSAIDALRAMAAAPGADSYTLAMLGRAYEAQDDRATAATYLDRAASPVLGEPAPFGMSEDFAILTREASSKDATVAVPRISQMLANGQTAAALAQAEVLRNANQGTPAAHMLVGDTLIAMNRPADAIGPFQRAADIHFSEPIAMRMIDAHKRAGDEAGALRVLDIFLQQNPRSVPALLLASEHFVAAGQWDPAEIVLTGLRARLGNASGAVLDNLGWVWFNKGSTEKALEAAAAAYALSPSNPAYTGNYGWLLFKTGKDKKAAQMLLRKAVAIVPQHPAMRYQLAQVLIDAGQKEAAKPHLVIAAGTDGYSDKENAAKLLATL